MHAKVVAQTSPKAERRKHAPKIQSKQFREWLDEPVFELDEFILTRRTVGNLTDTPCTAAASRLNSALKRMRINSLDRLFDVGLDGIMRIAGVGERSAWVAACVMMDSGYDIDVWCGTKKRGARSTRGAIRLVHASTRKQKHT